MNGKLTGASARARVTDILARGLEDDGPSTMQDWLDQLEGRGFGMILLLLGVAGAIPNIPGAGGAFGMLVMLVGAQMIGGRRTPWLPSGAGRRALARAATRVVLRRVIPWLGRLERWCRPRHQWLNGRRAAPLLGAVVVLLGVLLALPIPFTNPIPATALVVLATGMLERDGLLIGLGLSGTLVSTMTAILAGQFLLAGLLPVA